MQCASVVTNPLLNLCMKILLHFTFFLKNKFDEHMSFYETTDTPGFDFWSHLLWVSNESGQPYSHLTGAYVI